MNYSIQYLAHLVEQKNALNRRRRRFWKLAFNHYRTEKTLNHETNRYNYKLVDVRRPKCYAKGDGWAGYVQARSDMKAMTKHMREVRKELNASFVWDDTGNIKFIQFPDFKLRKEEIALAAWGYGLEEILSR